MNDASNVAGSPGELLSRRCVSLMKSALRPDMWPRAELKLQWFDKLLMTVVSRQAAGAWLHAAFLCFICFISLFHDIQILACNGFDVNRDIVLTSILLCVIHISDERDTNKLTYFTCKAYWTPKKPKDMNITNVEHLSFLFPPHKIGPFAGLIDM